MAVRNRELAELEAGLDALEQPVAARTARLVAVRDATWPPLAALVVVIGIWQFAYSVHLKDPLLLPAPGDVGRRFLDLLGEGHITEVIWNSLRRAAVGYLLALVLGTAAGLCLSRFRVLRRAIGPLLAGLQSLPSVAWVPFAILWFGISDAAIYFVAILGALPSVATGLVTAIDHVPPLWLRVGKAMGATGWSRYRHVVLPAALPGYLAGLKQAWSFSWRSLMAAELIAQSPDLGLGLGQLLHNGQDLLDMSMVVVAMGVILAVGVAIDVCVFTPLERGVRHRRGLTGATN